MVSSERITANSRHSASVHVRIGAELGQLVLVRAIAETAALLADFTLDEVADIRMALDEAATCLILAAAPDSRIRCDFTADAFRMRITVRGVCAEPNPIDESGFGWNVLHTITDHLAVEHDPYDAVRGGWPVIVTFSRLRRLRR
ncbi:ATP-binding protein [Nocardia mangyaensis]|uniref:ATP-binding protein n=1 Tax=Nocardia mangyaensis TaxID=2213200 RepID=UPI002675CDBD|nr:ATP-binding protein [Nocardia mangyaensis]MDO3646335.1 anti-sigma factor [Nocardia mangyaensis]